MMIKQKKQILNRRELLKLFGFSSAFLLSACVSKPKNEPGLGATQETKLAPTNPPSLEPDSEPTRSTEPSPEDGNNTAPTESPVPLTLEEEIIQIQQPLSLSPLAKDEWQTVPVIPVALSQRMLRLFAVGQKMGREARSFSVVGDCQTIPSYFLGKFDSTSTPALYHLGDTYAYLQKTIDYYQGSYKGGVAAHGGQNVAAVFSPFWVQQEDAALCNVNEGPLACELRLRNSAFTFISLEENWNGDTAGYVSSLERVVLYALSQGVIPILSTKANNLEGDHSINQAIVEIARRYEVPLWNFWASVQDLPYQGLDPDRFHLTLTINMGTGLDSRFDFRNPENLKTGWGIRNLTALTLLDFMRKNLSQEIGLGHQLVFLLESWILNS